MWLPLDTEYHRANADVLFQLRFMHCAMVSSFVLASLSLWMVNEKVRNRWRGVNELYGLYLLHYANGQIHVCLIELSVKTVTKRVFALYRFKSARVVSCWDLYVCINHQLLSDITLGNTQPSDSVLTSNECLDTTSLTVEQELKYICRYEQGYY